MDVMFYIIFTIAQRKQVKDTPNKDTPNNMQISLAIIGIRLECYYKECLGLV